MTPIEAVPEGLRPCEPPGRTAPSRGTTRTAASLAIVLSLTLQGLATTRVLCPPSSLGALGFLRIACSPALWPFTDYPMFSEPHRLGDALAWVEAWSVAPDGARTEHGAFRVLRATPHEAWASAFARTEARVSDDLAAGQAGEQHAASFFFERHQLVLTARGLIKDDGAGAEVR